MLKKIIFILLLTLIKPVSAYEVRNVCAKYQTNYSWSKSYNVQAKIYSGQELNQAVGSYTRFNSWQHYAVIWWRDGQASIIQMSVYYPGMILISHNGIDQTGRQWQLSDSNFGTCF